MYACPSCGAGIIFDPKTQKLLCRSCRNQYEPENIEKMRLDQAKEVEKKLDSNKEYEAIAYKCSHCGAELITTDETITTFCSFCRTGTMLDRKIIKKRKPDYIIPFKITKEDCEKIYINKIKKSIFAPKDMIDEQEVKKIRGIYMPYWIYSFKKHGNDSAIGSLYSYRSGDYVYYDDYSLNTNVDAECSGITHDATSNFYDRLSESIAPFSVKDKKDFSPAYLSGYYADNEDVNDNTYLDENKEIASQHLSRLLGKEKIYRKYKAKPKMFFNDNSCKLALFPVYFLATKNKRNDRISYAVVNGQTGKISADIPIDFKKFGLFSLSLAVILFFILNMLVSISMPKLIICSILFNIASLFILKIQNKKIKIRENYLDDKGVKHESVMEENLKKEESKRISRILLLVFGGMTSMIALSALSPFIIKILIYYPIIFKYIGYAIITVIVFAMLIKTIIKPKKDKSSCKPLIGLLITFLVFCIRPVDDVYYYFAALTSICFTIWTFYNIIKKYNILTTRKLPQLGARGGDENA